MKVIFLDIDGVLNRSGTKERLHTPTGQRHVGIDRELAAVFRGLVLKTGAKVVISSSWRKFYDPPTMQRLLADAGCECEVIGATGGVRFSGEDPRENSIREWLAKHPEVAQWVAIDDLSLWDLTPKFVQTDERYGLTPDLARTAAEILS